MVGASGSGKSTLLNLMAGLDTPTSGHVSFAGERLDGMGRRGLAAYRAGGGYDTLLKLRQEGDPEAVEQLVLASGLRGRAA